MIALLLVACLHPAPPPTIFPLALPTLEPPTVAEIQPAADELAAVAAYLPGQRPPAVTQACLVEPRGRGVVLPESKAVQLYQAAELGDWWEARALDCASYRALDRAYADQVVARQVEELDHLTRESRWMRWAVPAAMTLGIVMGVGAAELGDQVAP